MAAQPRTHTVSPIARPQWVRDLPRCMLSQTLTPSRPSAAHREYVIFLDTCTSRHSHRLAHRSLIGSTSSCWKCTATHSLRLVNRPPTDCTLSCSIPARPHTHSVSPIARQQRVRDLSRYLHIQALTPSRPSSPADRKYVIFLDTCISRHSHRLARRPATVGM